MPVVTSGLTFQLQHSNLSTHMIDESQISFEGSEEIGRGAFGPVRSAVFTSSSKPEKTIDVAIKLFEESAISPAVMK
ncbi:hypothetical protein ADUPG1_012357, partial [Aduncisulcus paluster]